MHRRTVLLGMGMAPALAAAPTHANAQAGARRAASITHGFHAAMTARPGLGDAVVELLFRAPAFENPDCLVFLIGRSASDGDKIFVPEGWTSQAAHGRFFDSDQAKAYVAELLPMLTGESAYLDEVVVGGKASLA